VIAKATLETDIQAAALSEPTATLLMQYGCGPVKLSEVDKAL
jgi:hypothetical protein